MGEARRRRLIEKAKTVRYSEPWPCPNCSDVDEIAEDGSDNVIYEVRDGWARCPRCGYGNRRSAFGFETHTVPPP